MDKIEELPVGIQAIILSFQMGDPVMMRITRFRKAVSWETGHSTVACLVLNGGLLSQGFETSELGRGGELGQQILDVVLEIP